MSLQAPQRKPPFRHMVHKHVRSTPKTRRRIRIGQYRRGNGLPQAARSSIKSGVPSYLTNGLTTFLVNFSDGERVRVRSNDLVNALDQGFNERTKSGTIYKIDILEVS